MRQHSSSKSASEFTGAIHLLKRVVEMNVIDSFFFDYFLRDPNMKINAVEVVDGKKQTLLDFLDLIVSNQKLHDLYSINEIQNLRTLIVQISKAKRGDEL